MQYAMQIFEDEDHEEFRVVNLAGEPWFVLADVCRSLDLKTKDGSYWHHAQRLDPDERQTIDKTVVDAATSPVSGGGVRRTGSSLICVSESGLYSLILTSHKPGAKRFKKWVTSEVLPSIRKTGRYRANTPAFIERFNQNFDRLLPGYFSVISELAIRVHGRLEMLGYTMPDRGPNGKECRPDVSVGQTFPRWLERHHPELAGSYEMYEHSTPEWSGPARQYHRSVLPAYLDFVDTVWLPQYGEPYFRKRDPIALKYLPMLLQSNNKPAITTLKRPASVARITRRAS